MPIQSGRKFIHYVPFSSGSDSIDPPPVHVDNTIGELTRKYTRLVSSAFESEYVHPSVVQFALSLALNELADIDAKARQAATQRQSSWSYEQIDALSGWLRDHAPDALTVDRTVAASALAVLDDYRSQLDQLRYYPQMNEAPSCELTSGVIASVFQVLDARRKDITHYLEDISRLKTVLRDGRDQNKELSARIADLETGKLALLATIAELEAKCSTNPSTSTPITVATEPCAPAAESTFSAPDGMRLLQDGPSSTADPEPAPAASTATLTTPSAARSLAIRAATDRSTKRYPMTTEVMKASVIEAIRANTVDGIAPTQNWIVANTEVPLYALMKRIGCKYSDLVAESGSQMNPKGRRAPAADGEPFRTI